MTDIRPSFTFDGIPWVYAPTRWIKALPASTSSTVAPPDQFPQPFLNAIQRFEGGRINEGDQYLKLFRIRAGLEDGTPSTADTDFAQYYALLMAYKLLDVLTARSLLPTDWEANSYLENLIGAHVPEFELTRKFNNWVDRLSTFRDQLVNSTKIKVPTFDSGTTTRYLCEYVSKSTSTTDISRPMNNISVAALHLHHLFKGHIDIAATQDVFAGLNIAPEVQQQFERTKLGNFKNPLHVALSLSPLLLFLQVNMIKKPVGRTRLLDAWKTTGRRKPQDIHRAESLAWAMLFDIASGASSVEDSVKKCLNAVLESDLVQTPWHDWFCASSSKLAKPAPQQTPASSTNIAPQYAPPPTPISPLDRRANQVHRNKSPLSRPRPTSSIVHMTPLQSTPRPPASSPPSPTQIVSAPSLLRSASLTRNDRYDAQDASPPPPSPGSQPPQEEHPEKGRENQRCSAPPPDEPQQTATPSKQQDRDVDMDQEKEPSVERNESAPQTVQNWPRATNNGDDNIERPGSSRRSRDEGETELSDEVQSKPPAKRKKKRKPTSTTGSKAKGAKAQRTARGKGAGGDGEDGDVEGESEFEEEEEARRKKPRTEVPDPPSDTSLPTVPTLGRGPFLPARDDSSVPADVTPSSNHTTTFDPASTRSYATSLTFHNVLNQEEAFELSFHEDGQLSWFQEGMDSVKLSAERVPLYLAQEDTTRDLSGIRLMSREEFGTKWRDLMGDFQKRHIVVVGKDLARYKFDAEGLSTVLPRFESDMPTTKFEDQSPLGVDSKIWPTARVLILADSQQAKDGHGKMLSYFNTKVDGPAPHHSLATEIYASQVTYAGRGLEYYLPEFLRWGHASTMGSYIPWNPSQFAGHFESVICGSRLFFLSRPKDNDKDPSRFLYNADVFSTYKTNLINSEDWDIEAVIVPAGSEIYIRPFTPYASISLCSSISHGAYFIPRSMIERIIIGLYQRWATTEETSGLHVAVEHASRAIISLWREHFVYDSVPRDQHIPDLETVEGAQQLFCLSAYRELANICCPDSYAEDDFSEGLSHDLRMGFIQSRELSRDLMQWFFANFTFENSSGGESDIRQTYYKYLAGIVKALLNQRKHHRKGTVGLERMEQLVKLSFEAREEFWRVYESDDVASSYCGRLEGTIITRNTDTKCFDTLPNGYTCEDLVWKHVNESKS
ncbi:hypothetical protein BDN72DRAFT_901615 [Pluteus cervinus]|uniref:Uncharacterized protein n=1 Tax=Pluteus cervinus TaxID=181527 RepID=A0ACD3AEQ3_9AGAR|nr:hypothetical protein BDN72DRAFT_901615 [Pluteus cervinus]